MKVKTGSTQTLKPVLNSTQSIRVRPNVKPTEQKIDEKIHQDLKIKKTTPHNLPINKTAVVNDKTGKISIVRQIEK